MGATYMGAQKASYNLPRDYSKNVCPIFKYSQNNYMPSAVPQKAATALTSECSRSFGMANGGTRNTNGERKVSETVYESGSTNGNISAVNGHGKADSQVSEVSVALKSLAIEKPIST